MKGEMEFANWLKKNIQTHTFMILLTWLEFLMFMEQVNQPKKIQNT